MTGTGRLKTAWAGLGSNLNPQHHLTQALTLLEQRFGALRVSPAYRNPAVGGSAPEFINLVLAFETHLEPEAIDQAFKEVESSLGRDRHCTSGRHPIDIDLLLLGPMIGSFGPITLPRRDVTEFAYVLKPLAELEPEGRHPVSKERFATLWERWDKADDLVEVAVKVPGSE